MRKRSAVMIIMLGLSLILIVSNAFAQQPGTITYNNNINNHVTVGDLNKLDKHITVGELNQLYQPQQGNGNVRYGTIRYDTNVNNRSEVNLVHTNVGDINSRARQSQRVTGLIVIETYNTDQRASKR